MLSENINNTLKAKPSKSFLVERLGFRLLLLMSLKSVRFVSRFEDIDYHSLVILNEQKQWKKVLAYVNFDTNFL